MNHNGLNMKSHKKSQKSILLKQKVSGCGKRHPDAVKEYPDALKKHLDAFIFQLQNDEQIR